MDMIQIKYSIYPINKHFSVMEPSQPQKRFQDFQQVFNAEGIAIGFTLPGNNYFFKYQSDGGWIDQKGTKFNADGVAQVIKDEQSEGEDDDNDEEILDQFQKMLDDDGKYQKKHKNEQNKAQYIPKEAQKAEQIDYEIETAKYIEQYKNKQKIRDGLPAELFIYYKMKRENYENLKLEVQKLESTAIRNEKVKNIYENTKIISQKLKQNNKWLNEEGQFDFSGVCEDDINYQRYWYGHVKTTAEKYMQIKESIDKSEQFALLELKTFYALKSKFYLKKKMQATIQNLQKSLQGLENNQLLTIIINNLPENFPCSYILDLFEYSATPLEEVHSIKLKDQYTAELKISKQGAIKFLNVEGFCHGEKDFIYLDIEKLSEKVKLEKGKAFSVTTDSDHKLHFSELSDAMALSQSPSQVLKMLSKQEEQKAGYRLIIGRQAIKKVLMYRGSSLNVTKIELWSPQ